MSLPVFRPATLDDAELAADIQTASYPPDPSDPVVTRYRWEHPWGAWSRARFIVEVDDLPIGLVVWEHGPWEQLPERHGYVEVWLDRAVTSTELLTLMLEWIENQAVEEGIRNLNGFAGEDEPELIDVFGRLGYRLDRTDRVWELDLIKHGERLLSEAAAAREEMSAQGISMITLADWRADDRFQLLHALDQATTQDIPHSVPILPMPLEDFMDRLASPDMRHDRYWIALDGDQPVAISRLRFPPVRGHVWTGYTCCAASHRGRGIARAVKLQGLAQAIELGIPFVRTDNDSQNAPMLAINERLGYHSRPAFLSFTKTVER